MQLPPIIAKLLDEIAESEGFTQYKIGLKSGSNHGDNYSDSMISVKMIGVKSGESSASSAETWNLLCELAPACKERRKLLKTDRCFEREIDIFECCRHSLNSRKRRD